MITWKDVNATGFSSFTIMCSEKEMELHDPCRIRNKLVAVREILGLADVVRLWGTVMHDPETKHGWKTHYLAWGLFSAMTSFKLSTLIVCVSVTAVFAFFTVGIVQDFVIVNSPIKWLRLDADVMNEMKSSRAIWVIDRYWSRMTLASNPTSSIDSSQDAIALRRFVARNNVKFVEFDVEDNSEIEPVFRDVIRCVSMREHRFGVGVYIYNPNTRYFSEIDKPDVSDSVVVNEVRKSMEYRHPILGSENYNTARSKKEP